MEGYVQTCIDTIKGYNHIIEKQEHIGTGRGEWPNMYQCIDALSIAFFVEGPNMYQYSKGQGRKYL